MQLYLRLFAQLLINPGPQPLLVPALYSNSHTRPSAQTQRRQHIEVQALPGV